MVEPKEPRTLINFTMLTEKLYNLFIQYIVSGRTRAPPEMELCELVNSFQLGAKTDRRALQSKFKSWSKRMKVENGVLKLISSNKEIIPIQKCKELVMGLHSDDHKSVAEIMSQLDNKYTLTKKNFGMDKCMVMNIIASNCMDPICRQRGMEENFIRDVIKSSDCRFQTLLQQNSSMFNSSMYAWPVRLSSTSSENSSVNNLKPMYFTAGTSSLKTVGNDRFSSDSNSQSYSRSSTPRKRTSSFMMPFRKPKYIHEFKALVSAAERVSSSYPAILNDPKTKFLCGLDLVPKKICSKKTLMKVEREKKKRKILEKHHKCRKNLRDRNKLNKIKLKEQREKRAYLNVSKHRKSDSGQFVDSTDEQSSSTSNETLDAISLGRVDFPGSSEIHAVSIIPSEKEHEIISIESSEDEDHAVSRISSGLNSNDNKPANEKDSVVSGVKQTKFRSTLSQMLDKVRSQMHGIPNTSKPLQDDSKIGCNRAGTKQFSIQPNVKRQFAILQSPASSSSTLSTPYPTLKIYKGLKPTGIKKLRFKNLKAVHSCGRYTNLPATQNVNVDGNKTHNKGVDFKSDTIGQLPADTNIYLIQKSENGIIKKVPYKIAFTLNTGATNIPATSDFKRNVITPEVKSPIITTLSSEKNEGVFKVPNTKENNLSAMLRLRSDNISYEMSKLLLWIRTMKVTMVQTFFQQDIERSAYRLQSQLNTGIALVRCVRRRLREIEKLEKIKSRRMQKFA